MSEFEPALTPCLEIRLAGVQDFDTVARFDATDDMTSFSKQSGGKFIAALIQSESVFLALVDHTPVGYARIDYLWPERCPLLSWLYVEDAFRKTGIGNRLRRHVFDATRAKGYEAILRSACSARPHMVRALQETCLPAGTLTWLNGSVEHFFWHKL